MRKILFISLYCLVSYNAFSQIEIVLNMKLSDAISNVADSMRLSYPHNNRFYTSFESSLIMYRVGNGYVSLNFPPKLPDEKTANEVFRVIDSLARSQVYTNKLVANRVATAIAGYYSIRRDTVCYYCDNTLMEPWQEKLVLDLVRLDIDHCMRIMMDGNMAIRRLPRHLFTPEIVEKIKQLYSNPLLTPEEAKIFAQREGPSYRLADTAGFSALRDSLYHMHVRLSEEKRSFTERIQWEIDRATEANMTLEQYYDSLNNASHERSIKANTGRQFIGIQSLIIYLGNKRIYELAPMIDSIYHSELSKNWKAVNFKLELARLGYKDYPDRQIERFGYRLDTTVHNLNNNTLTRNEIQQSRLLLTICHRRLFYINSQESIFRTAPLLMINTKDYLEEEGRGNLYKLGTIFFIILDRKITNFPWDRKKYEIEKEGEPPVYVDEWYIENKMPEDFLEKMYQWMIENKGNYELTDN